MCLKAVGPQREAVINQTQSMHKNYNQAVRILSLMPSHRNLNNCRKFPKQEMSHVTLTPRTEIHTLVFV